MSNRIEVNLNNDGVDLQDFLESVAWTDDGNMEALDNFASTPKLAMAKERATVIWTDQDHLPREFKGTKNRSLPSTRSTTEL